MHISLWNAQNSCFPLKSVSIWTVGYQGRSMKCVHFMHFKLRCAHFTHFIERPLPGIILWFSCICRYFFVNNAMAFETILQKIPKWVMITKCRSYTCLNPKRWTKLLFNTTHHWSTKLCIILYYCILLMETKLTHALRGLM